MFELMGKKNCCYQCKDRKVGCHAQCKKYQQFKLENAKERLQIKTNMLNSQIWIK